MSAKVLELSITPMVQRTSSQVLAHETWITMFNAGAGIKTAHEGPFSQHGQQGSPSGAWLGCRMILPKDTCFRIGLGNDHINDRPFGRGQTDQERSSCQKARA